MLLSFSVCFSFINFSTSRLGLVKGLDIRWSQRVVGLHRFLAVYFKMADNFKAMASQAMTGSPAGMVAILDSLKMIKISEVKTLREVETWMSAIDTAIQRNKECAPEATRTLKWTWKVLSNTHGGDVSSDQGCPVLMDQLKEFVREERYPKAKARSVEAYLLYYTDGLFTVQTDVLTKIQASKFFEKGQATMAPALKWRMTAYVTRTLFQSYVAEKNIVKKLQNGDFEG